VNAKYPDFKNKKTKAALWLADRRTPAWVKAEMTAMTPGTIQLDVYSWNRRLSKYVKAGKYQLGCSSAG
jgi:hypothetical protein